MFGKGKAKMSSSARFVMSKGREAGNLKGMARTKDEPVRGDRNGKVQYPSEKSLGKFDTFKTRGK